MYEYQVTSVTAELYSGRDYAAQPRSLYAAIADNSVTIFCVIAVFAASHGQHTSDLHSKFALRPHHVWKYGRHPIPFLVPRRKVWLTPTARVPCSNAANIGERKTWTQSEYCTWQNSVMGQEPPKMYIVRNPRRRPKIVQSLVGFR